MGLGCSRFQWRAAAIQQAEVRRALDQAEKMLSGIARFVDAQGTALVDLGQQAFHA
ncbi:hypothetical protein D3C84_1193290 [compost metagenome]